MSFEYDIYLNQHIGNVNKALEWIIDNLNIYDYLEQYQLDQLKNSIVEHDSSKYGTDEYETYDMYFYGNNRSTAVLNQFNYARLHHIHSNKHHWQHWVLFEDDLQNDIPYKALEMYKEYVVEMICDWWSFSFNSGNLYEIFDWYDDHKEKMVLHKNTRQLVERILQDIKNKLDDIS